MLTQDLEIKISQQVKILSVVHLAILFTSIFIAVLPFSGLIIPDTSFKNETANNILLFIGLSNIVLGHYIPAIFFKTQKAASNKEDLSKKLNQYVAIIIVGLALRESAVIIGFLAYFLTGDIKASSVLSILGVLSLFFAKPSIENLKRNISPMI